MIGPRSNPFLAAVVANPRDDLPRLVYADWLDENGDALRAEFIRLQCQLAQSQRTGILPQECVPLFDRQATLWHDHGERWRADWPRSPHIQLHYDRGFPDTVILSSGTWNELERPLARIFEMAPIARLVVHRPAIPVLEQLLILNWPRRLTMLGVLTPGVNAGALVPIGPSTLVRRLADADLPELEELYLPQMGLDDVAAVVLSRARWLGQLVQIDITSNDIGPEGLSHLARRFDATRLRKIAMLGNRFDHDSAVSQLHARFPKTHFDFPD